MGGGKGASSASGGVIGSVADAMSIDIGGKDGDNGVIRSSTNDKNMGSPGRGSSGNGRGGYGSSVLGSSGSSSSIHDDRNHSNAAPISSTMNNNNNNNNTSNNHGHTRHVSSSSEMDQMYQQNSPSNDNHQQHQQQYNRNHNHHHHNNNHNNNNHHKKQSTLRQSTSSGGSISKQRYPTPQTTERFEKNGVSMSKNRSYQSPGPQRIQQHNNHTRPMDMSMDTTGTNQSHLCVQNQTNTTITTNHTSSSVPNLSIFKSPMAKYRPVQKNMYDERSREWKKPPSLHSQQPSKYQERFQYPADIARWTKLNAMLKPY